MSYFNKIRNIRKTTVEKIKVLCYNTKWLGHANLI